jgi:iron complex transport system substrate-binding protein
VLCCCVAAACLASAAQAAIELSQPNGDRLVLDQPARRLVTLAPHLTELTFTAGAGDTIVATVEYSDYPQAALRIPRIGDAFRLDIERIVALRPDLVIAWDSGNPRRATEQLRALGLRVWSLEIREPIEIADALEAIGSAVGRVSDAGHEADIIRRRLRSLEARYRNLEEVDYFYQVGKKPLFTINGEHLISKGLSMCGGRNVFADEAGLAFQVSREAVIVTNPAVMFAPGQAADTEPLSVWREWTGIRAVADDALFVLPADPISRASPRFLDSLELACKLLHRFRARGSHE